MISQSLIRSSSSSLVASDRILLNRLIKPVSILSRHTIAGNAFATTTYLAFRQFAPEYQTIRHFTTVPYRLQNKIPENKSISSNQPSISQKNMELTSLVTKATLLSQANSKLHRMLIHIKWPLLRNTRSTSSWDIASAFISWLVMGNLLWIILGTTTFGLMAMYAIHYSQNLYDTLTDDEKEDKTETRDNSILGYITGSILSFGLGIKIQFEKGSILPELKDGRLRFKNVTVVSDGEDEATAKPALKAKIEAMDVKLSFNKWYEGNGLIYDLEIFGLNGKVHRNEPPKPAPINQQDHIQKHNSNVFSYRHHENIHYQYDMTENDEEMEELSSGPATSFIDSNYQLEHVKIHDSYLEIYDSCDKPLCINIFNCDLPKLRGDRILLDFFNANNASGAINDSMFTIHKRQMDNDELHTFDRTVRFKLDAIDLGAISRANPQLKFNWIINGKAEVVADIRLPNLEDRAEEFQLSQEYKKLSGLVSKFLSGLSSLTHHHPSSDVEGNEQDTSTLLKDAISAIYHTFNNQEHSTPKEQPSSYVMVDVKVKLHDLKASVPKYLPVSNSNNMPFISLTDLRTLIGYINNESQPITINTTVIEKLSGLYNVENLSSTKMFDYIVGDIYEELGKLVKLDERRIIKEKSSMWSHSIASQLLLLGLGVIV